MSTGHQDTSGVRVAERAGDTAAVIVVYSDIGCPWASLAMHHLTRAAAVAHREILVDHRAFPLELFNRRPTPKAILDPEVVAIAAMEPDLGWRPWPGPDTEYPVSTLLAMEAVQAAKEQDAGLRASGELDAALRRAFYVEGRCISLHSEVMTVAERCPNVDADRLEQALIAGTARASLFAQWRFAATPTVQGSPHLFLPDGTGSHNPGIRFHWTGTGTDRRPVIDEYNPDVWTSIVQRAVTTR